jgi:Immunity protein 50
MYSETEMLDAIYRKIPGGAELLSWFGQVPSFHDAEIMSLELNRRGPSYLKIHGWIMNEKTDEEGHLVPKKHSVVTFELDQIIDLRLEGFSSQNVIYGLSIRHADPDPERAPNYSETGRPDDFEVTLEPCYGMDGLIRCRSISLSFVPGLPADKDPRSRSST